MFRIYISRRSHREIAIIIIILKRLLHSYTIMSREMCWNGMRIDERIHIFRCLISTKQKCLVNPTYTMKNYPARVLFSNHFFRTASVFVWVSDNLNVREMWNGQWVRHMAVAVFVRDLITSIMWFILFYGNLVKELRPKIHNFFALTRLKLIFACCSWRLNSLAHSVYDCTLDVRGKVVDEKFFFPFQYFRDTANRSDAVRCEPNVLLRVQPEISHKIHNQMDSD